MQAAAACIERHLEHALAVGADGTWLDNMGPNVYGAKTSTGLLLGSYDLRYPTEAAPDPCPRELAGADLEGPELPPGEAQVMLARWRIHLRPPPHTHFGAAPR